ncbi:MAG: hypothetical protein KDE19_16555 [Caldilineaceae bacterium]|nr:hypothetical protein [Caldilineaceae bacterium]
MKSQRDIASFVLRFTQDIWRDVGGDPRVEWRGHIRRVQDGEELRFKDLAEAMHFIQNSLMQVTANAVANDDKTFHEKAMRESLKIWEKFAESYATIFVNTVEKSVKQSEAFQKQMTEAVEQVMKPWWLMGLSTGQSGKGATTEEASNHDAQILQTLAVLQEQVQLLNDKVDRLMAEKTK